MDVTLLIPAYNGRESLSRLLTTLAAAHPAENFMWDAIVVDNNSADDTKDVVATFQEHSLPMLRYVFEARPGKCRALNRGLEYTTGDFVAFLDHDVVLDPDYFVALGNTIRSYPYNVFGGRVVPLWSSPAPAWLTDGTPLRTSRGGVVAHDYGDTPRLYDPTMRLPIGCNFFCRRSLFDIVGLFNVHLGPRPGIQMAGEENDILRRFEARGERIFYAPSVTVFHPVDPRRITKSYFRYRLFCYGRGVCRASVGQSQSPTLFNVPLHLYRRLIQSAGRGLLAACQGDSYRAFDCQLDVCYTLGSIYEFRRIARRGIED